MKPDALQVAIDILRELGLDEQARWLENPQAVRELLRHTPHAPLEVEMEEVGAHGMCPACEWPDDDVHQFDCKITAAWRALGDPRGAADIDTAHDQALQEEVLGVLGREERLRFYREALQSHHPFVAPSPDERPTCPLCRGTGNATDGLSPCTACGGVGRLALEALRMYADSQRRNEQG